MKRTMILQRLQDFQATSEEGTLAFAMCPISNHLDNIDL